MRRGLAGLILILTLALGCDYAQTPNVALNDAKTYEAARIGLNLGGNGYSGSYLLSNLLGINPGFQPHLIAQQVSVASGTTTSFTDSNSWTGVTANYFAGGTFQVLCHGGQQSGPIQVCTGGAGPAVASVIPETHGSIGCSGKILSNTAAVGGKAGATYTLGAACTAALAQHDQVVIYAPHTPTSDSNLNFNYFGWGARVTGGGAVTVDSTKADFPPAPFSGIQVLKLNTGDASGAMAGIQTAFDTGLINYFFRGSYTQCIRASVKSGDELTITMQGRRTGHGASWSTSVSPSGPAWKRYCATFTVANPESASSVPYSAMQISFTLSGRGAILVSGPTLVSSADANNGTEFLTSTLDDIKLWNPGECRYWGGQNGDTLDNLLAPQASRFTSSVYLRPTYLASSYPMQIGIHDFLVAAHAAGCESVSIAMPITWRWNVDAENFVDYLNGSAKTVYGAKRIALGQTAGWPSVFKRIVVDYGNEVWNPGAGDEAMIAYSVGPKAFWNYIPLAIQFCGAMKHDPNFTSNIYCGATMQTANAAGNTGVLAASDTHHYVDLTEINEYGQFTVNNTEGKNPWISAWTEAWANVFDKASRFGYYQSNHQGIRGATYEGQNSTGCIGGPGSKQCSTTTQAEVTGYPEGEGYALADILMPLYDNREFGTLDWDFFTMFQRNTGFKNNSGASISIADWGAWTGPGGEYNNPRPMVYASSMVNGCIGTGDTGIQTSPTHVPTYNFAGYNGVNAQRNVPYLHFFAFKTGGTRCIVAVNTDPVNPYTFTVSGTNPPSGAVTQTLFTSANLTDNNEAPNSTPAVRLSKSSSSNPKSFTLPAHSAMTISYAAGGGDQAAPGHAR